MRGDVVLDSYHSDALLKLAMREKLLVVDHSNTDGVFRRYETDPQVPDTVVRRIFENIVMAEKVYVRTPLMDRVHGRVIEAEKFHFITDINPSVPEQGEVSFSPEFLLAFLRARGQAVPLEQINDIVQEAIRLESGFEHRYGGVPFLINAEGYPFEEVLRRVSQPEGSPRFTDDEIKQFKRYNLLQQQLHPVMEALKELQFVEKTALKLEADRLIFIDETNRDYIVSDQPNLLLKNGTIESVAGVDQQYIFKLACDQLGRIPIRPTLEGTLGLSLKAETSALRTQVRGWVTALSHMNVTEQEYISREISSARKWIEETDQTTTAVSYVGLLGLPISIGSLILPEMAALGLTGAGLVLTGIGALSFVGGEAVKNRYRWLMFGS